MADTPAKRYEKLFDLPFDGKSDDKHINKAVAIVVVSAVWAICKSLWRFTVEKRENLMKLADVTGVVVVSNHTSYLDVVFMYLSIYPKHWPRFVARNTLFDGKPYAFASLLAHLGVFPIHRDTADRTAIKRAARMLKNGEIVCILPEGTRRGKGTAKPNVHGGAALIARMGRAPILPMTVRDVEKIKMKGERLRFPKVSVEYGTPLEVADFDFLPKEDRLEGCTWYALRECFALSRRCEPEEVDMTELFPDSKDFTAVFAEHGPIKHTSDEIAAKYAKSGE